MGALGGLVKGENVSVPAGTLFTALVSKTTLLYEDMEQRQGVDQFKVNSEVDQKLNEIFDQLKENEDLD